MEILRALKNSPKVSTFVIPLQHDTDQHDEWASNDELDQVTHNPSWFRIKAYCLKAFLEASGMKQNRWLTQQDLHAAVGKHT